MKKVLRVSVLVLLITSCKFAGKVKDRVLPENRNQGTEIKETRFEFTGEMHNFGNLTSGERVIHGFRFKNTGTNDLKIEKVTSDCGCVTLKYSNNPVKPGEEEVIEAEFNTSGLYGKQMKSIIVNANIPGKTKTLYIGAEIFNKTINIDNNSLTKATEK